MRGLIVLCLVAVGCADKLGYNYQPVGHSTSGLSFVPGSIHGGGALGINSGYEGVGGGLVGGSYAGPVEYNKEFYFYSAPEHEFNDDHGLEHIASKLKKNIRVIFIKAPENNGLNNAALQLARQAAEQKTAIYVLSRQHDLSELANGLSGIRNSYAQKPEVHFVKYRTHEDAVHAQHQIQSQYDALGGPSHLSDEGHAPVLNFASPGHHGYSHNGGGLGFSGGYPNQPSRTYLPIRFRRRS